MRKIKHVTKRDEVAFLNDLANSIMCSDKDIELSILLQSDMAQYIDEVIEDKCGVFRIENDFENDFGKLTGLCLVTIVKEGMSIQVIVEDYAFEDQYGVKKIKYHEADILMILEGHAYGNVNSLITLYKPKKTIFVAFEDDSEEIASLLFS